jgi:hypothetical protein
VTAVVEGEYFSGFTLTAGEVENVENYRAIVRDGSDAATDLGADVLIGMLLDRNRALIALRAEYDRERSAASTARMALETFRDRVVSVTVDYDGGCRDGKTHFLRSLGLDYPTMTYRVTASWYVTADEEPYSGDISDAICQNLDCDDNPDVSVTESN